MLFKLCCFIFGMFFLTSCYVTKQTWYQAKLLSERRSILEVIEDESISSNTKQKLDLVLQVREFAKNQGLNVGGSYSQYIELPNDVITYIVYAAKPYELSLKKWWFPFVGSVPYLGFFNQHDRDKKSAELIKQGYEVENSASIGMSFLGWMVDPIYSSMLNRPNIEIVHLFLHELVHKTYWYPGDVEFNENLAEFVALELTQKFYANQPNTNEVKSYLARRDDRATFRVLLKQLKKSLNELYQTKSIKEIDNTKLLDSKNLILNNFKVQLKETKFKTNLFSDASNRQWNNAAIASTSMYIPDTESFATAYRCASIDNMGIFLKMLQKKANRLKSGEQALASFCEASLNDGPLSKINEI